MKRLALRGALTAKLGDDAIRVIDALRPRGDQDPRPRRRPRRRSTAHGRVLVVAPGRDETARAVGRATCRRSSVILADSLNVVDLLNADVVLIEQPALARMEEVYA